MTFTGRAPRSEYWYWVLFVLIGGAVTGILDYAVFSESEISPLNAVFNLILFLPSLAIGIRRLHDLDRTGWWTLIALTIIGLILLLIWACTKGTTGPNRFGADPLGGTA